MSRAPGDTESLKEIPCPLEPNTLEEYRNDPRRAITESGVICLFCGYTFRHLTNTHLRKHGLTSDEYKQQFGYNSRRALMVSSSLRIHSDNARKHGLASHIRNRRLVEDPELKRRGGQHPRALEEVLTRRDRPPQFFNERIKSRDTLGRFAVTAMALDPQSLVSEGPTWTEFTLRVNGRLRTTGKVASDMPLLWILRDTLNLKGTKYGCGIGACGACTVHLNGQPQRACQILVSSVGSQLITTIEGLSNNGSHPVQRAWLDVDVPQCGYCQAGQLMSAAALLAKISDPTDGEINAAMNGNICRCGTYLRIREAIHLAAQYARE